MAKKQKKQQFDVHCYNIVRVKVCRVAAKDMLDAAKEAPKHFDINMLLNPNLWNPSIRPPYVDCVEATGEDTFFAVEKAGNGDKEVPDNLTMLAQASGAGLGSKATVLVEIPFSHGPKTKLGDLYQFIQKIALLKTEDEQDEAGDEFSNDEHVENLDLVIEEAREMLGQTEKGTKITW